MQIILCIDFVIVCEKAMEKMKYHWREEEKEKNLSNVV